MTQWVTEKEFQASVQELAVPCGWRTYHVHDSRRQVRDRGGLPAYVGDKDIKGFPDLVLVRPPRTIFAELKKEKGRVTPEQRQTLNLLGECPGVETYLWRPSDWDQIMDILK